MNSEEWKDIPGYEGRYQASSLGRIRSLDCIVIRSDGRKHTVKGRIMKMPPLQSGHLHLNLRTNGITKSALVHVLVLTTFVGSCPPGMECCHENDIPSDNSLGNLSWGTRKKNMEDRRRNGKLVVGENATGARLTSIMVREIRERVSGGETQTAVGIDFGISNSQICLIVNRKAWVHVY